MAGIKFDFMIGDDNLRQKLSEINDKVNETAEIIENLSKNGFDTSTAEARIESLKTIIEDNNAAFRQLNDRLNSYAESAREALNSGDWDLYDTISKDIEKTSDEMKELNKETEKYQQSLELLEKANSDVEWEQVPQKSKEAINTTKESVDGLGAFFKKFKVGWLALATAIGKGVKTVFTDWKDHTQIIGDTFKSVTGGMKQAYNEFLTLLSGGRGWDNFVDNIKRAYDNGKKFARMLDELFEMNNSFDIYEAKTRQEIEKWRVASRDVALTEEERIKAAEKVIELEGKIADEKRKVAQMELNLNKQRLQEQTGLYDEDDLAYITEYYSKNRDIINQAKEYTALMNRAANANNNAFYVGVKTDKMVQDENARVEELMEPARALRQKVLEETGQDLDFIAGIIKKYNLSNDELVKNYVQSLVKSINVETDFIRNTSRMELTISRMSNKIEENEDGMLKSANRTEEELAALRMKNFDSVTELLAKGTEQRTREIESAYWKEVQEIDKQRRAWEEQAGEEGLTPEQNYALLNAYALADQKRRKAMDEMWADEAAAMDAYLMKWGDTEQKREAITKMYQDKIAKAETVGERMALQKEFDQAIVELEMHAEKGTSIISRLFTDMRNKSMKELKTLKTQGAQLLEMLKEGIYDPEKAKDLKVDESLFESILNSPEQLKAISDAVDNIINRVEAMQHPIEAATEALQELFASGGDTNLATEAVNKLSNATNKLVGATSLLTEAFDAFSKLAGNKDMENFATTLENVTTVIGDAVAGAQAGAAVGGGYGAIIGAVLGGGTSLAKILAENVDSAQAGAIESYRRQIVALKLAYDDLNDAIGKAFGQKQSQLYLQEAENLEQQRDLVQRQLEEELDKKNVDQFAVESYEEQLRSLDRQIDATKDKAIDAIIGSDITSAITSFADAYASAWENGESKATTAKQTVVKLMKDTVKEAIKTATDSSEIMQNIRRKLAEFMFDNVLDDFEQKELLQMSDTLQKKIDSEFGWADGLMSGRSAGITGGSSRALSTMSEETGSALEGRFTAFQISNDLIADRMQESLGVQNSILTIVTSNNDVLSDLLEQAAKSNSFLEDIAKYSKAISLWGENVEKIAKNTENI